MSSDIVLVDEDTKEEIKQLNINMARLRRDLPEIIKEEIQIQFSKLLRELRKPKPYVEVGYRG
jgi:hypothetical protein